MGILTEIGFTIVGHESKQESPWSTVSVLLPNGLKVHRRSKPTNKKTLKLDMILIKKNDERKRLKKSEYDGDKLINVKFFIFWK